MKEQQQSLCLEITSTKERFEGKGAKSVERGKTVGSREAVGRHNPGSLAGGVSCDGKKSAKYIRHSRLLTLSLDGL
jgi:hypothetical protein